MAMNQGVMDGASYREPTHGPENLLRLLALLWRNILIIVLSGLLLAALAFGASLLIPNYYSATTQILLDPEGSRILDSDLTAQPRAVDSHVLNQQYLLTSNELLTRVVEKENLQNDPEFGAYNSEYTDSKSRTQLAVDRLRKAESVAIVGKSFIVNVTVRSSSPEQAAKLANTIADTYLELRSEMNADTLKRTGGGLSAQLEQLRKAVEDGDRAVQDYRAKHNLANVAGRPDIEQQISDTNAEIARLSGTIAENEALVSELRQARNDRQYLRSVPDSSLTPSIISLRARYQQSQEEQAVLATSLGAQHPALQAARARTQSLATILDDQLRNFSTTASRNLDRLKNQLTLLQTNLDRLTRNQNGEESTMVQLRELQRKLDSDRAVYESFLLRTRQLSEQQGTPTENSRIISVAEAPLKKAGPPRTLITTGAGIFGMILAAGILVLRDQFGGKSRKVVARAPSVFSRFKRAKAEKPGVTPPVEKVQTVQSPPVPLVAPVAAVEPVPEPTHPVSGMIPAKRSRALLANQRDDYVGLVKELCASVPLAQGYSMLIASVGPQNRASHAAFNLAFAAARLGRRVLLADGASRDPALTRMLLDQSSAGTDNGVANKNERGGIVDFEDSSLLKFLPADADLQDHLSGKMVSEESEAFDLIIVDGGVASAHPVSAPITKMLDEVVLMQNEEDAGSTVLSLVALEESGLQQARVVRQDRSGLHY
ncbi:GumC family protein [Agrobacterium larrymoorei]|uniref:GumC family protein n=1 Tax=Agrobacterium larrymoorei TaxID=160699 RepID=UPI0030BA7064